MENRINIAELLKDCPSGMELDCTMYDKVTLLSVYIKDPVFPITVLREDGCAVTLTKYGQYTDVEFAKCVIFPKGKTTWEGFQRPSKDGDVVVCEDQKMITQMFVVQSEHREGRGECYFGYNFENNSFFEKGIWEWNRLATEEEKQKLFKTIKDYGYRWNVETKTLEELVKPIFKRGDTIRSKKKRDENFYILSVDEDSYMIDVKGFCIKFKDQDNFELASAKFDINTLKPFKSEVLIRDTNRQAWTGAFYSHYDVKDDYPYHCINFGRYKQCIPYEGNEHLLGKTNDCNDYYKTWK